MNDNIYLKAFEQNAGEYFEQAMDSAMEVLPYVFDIVKPRSVVDIGCGGGAWLSACNALGVGDILGVDGDYVEPEKLKIPRQKFMARDLRQPIILDRTFDLAISLEVAEHIPQHHAETFVNSLAGLAPVVLFSGAIPFQGGVGHVNEQWPTYWSDRFRLRGYEVIDCIRRRVWNNDRVNTWYKQNIVLFVENKYLESHDILLREARICNQLPLNIVHPNRYLAEADPRNIDFRKVPLGTAWAALKLQTHRRVRAGLHWRLQRLLRM